MLLLTQRNKLMFMPSICFKTCYMFCLCFKLFILVGLQQTTGLPSLMPIFAGYASSYSSLYSSSVIFWSYKVLFSEK